MFSKKLSRILNHSNLARLLWRLRRVRPIEQLTSLKFALVKQEVYQDLYVAPAGSSAPIDILASSIMRVGPIGLFTRCNCKFYIVKESFTPECQIYRRVIPSIAESLSLLKNNCANYLPGMEFLKPGCKTAQGEFAVDVKSVNWSDFDVVVSINVSIPSEVVANHKRTLFVYMIGEANMCSDIVRFGYDACFTQLTRGKVSYDSVIDFPYTFLGDSCLETIMSRYLGRPSANTGVYVEINSCDERPVMRTPHTFLAIENQGFKIRLHRQNVMENLTQVYDARYFVKIGGRQIRGNSILEAISCGTLVLLNPKDCTHRELIIPETSISNSSDALRLMRYLDGRPEVYENLLIKQRRRLHQFGFAAPLESVHRVLERKRRRL